MSESMTTEEELTKLKLSELKKLCKKYNLSTTGTKIDLVSRLIENKGDTFTVLQPGDEAKLLGDVVDDDSTSYALTDASALDTLDVTHEDMPVSPDVDQVVLPNQNTLAGSKRSSVVLEDASTAQSAVSPSKVSNTHLPTENSTGVALVSVSPPTQENDRLSARAARFGLPTSRPPGGGTLGDDKLAARARRFGLPVGQQGCNQRASLGQPLNKVSSVAASDYDPDKLKKRAERFGEITSSFIEKITEDKRKASRLDRFGSCTAAAGEASKNVTDESKEEELKAARALKFNIQNNEDALLKRKARFGIV
ncbi:hypothetical protein EG68_10007 [Paragonimus skrjabini miyazakii]|uniref:SAP domain-containing protein n=1 Tax=Paragonimus skrjabini miyazakii TaxID=59628 RepID=A0A8S9YFZ1_9TREM|nr:hypothetical protein EG68_10007 [Paragonimus skrjabini miyazakii]